MRRPLRRGTSFHSETFPRNGWAAMTVEGRFRFTCAGTNSAPVAQFRIRQRNAADLRNNGLPSARL